jgi:hypothetical protein
MSGGSENLMFSSENEFSERPLPVRGALLQRPSSSEQNFGK